MTTNYNSLEEEYYVYPIYVKKNTAIGTYKFLDSDASVISSGNITIGNYTNTGAPTDAQINSLTWKRANETDNVGYYMPSFGEYTLSKITALAAPVSSDVRKAFKGYKCSLNNTVYSPKAVIEGLTVNGATIDSVSNVTFTAVYDDKYKVTFLDRDGNQIGEAQYVIKGGKANAPEPPSVSGYTFEGWNKDFSNITEDTVVTARYKSSSSGEAVIRVSNVALNKTSLAMTVGEYEVISATVMPADATDKSVTWSSDNDSVATVDSSGKITAVSAGTANITVTTVDGEKIAKCKVTVEDKREENPIPEPTPEPEPTPAPEPAVDPTPTPAPSSDSRDDSHSSSSSDDSSSSSSSDNSSSDSSSSSSSSSNSNSNTNTSTPTQSAVNTLVNSVSQVATVPSYTEPGKVAVVSINRVNTNGTITNVTTHIDGTVSETTRVPVAIVANINATGVSASTPTVVNNLSVVVDRSSATANARTTAVTAVVEATTINGNMNLTPQMISSIKNAVSSQAGTKASVGLKVNTLAADGKALSVIVSTDALKNNASLKGYVKDPLTGGYIMVDVPNVKYNNKTGLTISGLASGLEYQFVSAKEAKAIENSILNSVKVSNEFANPVSATAGSIVDMTKALSPSLNAANVSKVEYKVSGNKATINPVTGQLMISGNATKGTITVSIKVTLKNGKTKTIKTKIKIG